WLWLHRIGADLAIGRLPTAPATVEDGDSIVAKSLERPVDAGRAAKFARVGASWHDDDVIVIVDAEAADQSLNFFERRQLAWNTLYFHAPARGAIGRVHRAGDVPLRVWIDLVDDISDVEDDKRLVIEVLLEPCGIDKGLVG